MCSAALLNCLSPPSAKRMLIACGSAGGGGGGGGGGGEVKRSVGIFVKSLSTYDMARFRGASEL